MNALELVAGGDLKGKFTSQLFLISNYLKYSSEVLAMSVE